MKLLYVFFLLLVLSCNTVKKEYVCGDHPCIDKKEFNEYFSKNLSIEIKTKQNKKNKTANLVKLNTDTSLVKKKVNRNSKKDEKIRIKNEKEQLKIEKIRLLEERKIRENKEKNKTVKLKENNIKSIKNEIKNNRERVDKIVEIIPEEKKPKKNTKKVSSINAVNSKNVKSICDEIKDCDIDKIAELLIKKGKDKPYPNIASN
jgi:hypothetical protein